MKIAIRVYVGRFHRAQCGFRRFRERKLLSAKIGSKLCARLRCAPRYNETFDYAEQSRYTVFMARVVGRDRHSTNTIRTVFISITNDETRIATVLLCSVKLKL